MSKLAQQSKPDSNQKSKPDGAVSAEPQAFTKILAIINENSSISPALNYLKKREFEVRVSHNLMDGIDQLSKFKPEILLLSWNLKNTDIKKVYSLITQKFSSICFIIAEEDNNKTVAGMLSSGLPNTILYPVGGMNLFTRIQTALGKYNPNQSPVQMHRARTRDKTVLGGKEFKRPKRNEIAKDTEWNIRVTSGVAANQVWEAVVSKPGGKTEYIYYKGETPPDKWLSGTDGNAGDRQYVFSTDHQASAELLSSFQDYTESKAYNNDFDDELDDEDDHSTGGLNSKAPQKSANLELPVNKENEAGKKPAATAEKNPKKSASPTPAKDEDFSIFMKEKRGKSENRTQTLLEKSVNVAVDMAMKTEVKSFEAPILIDKVSNLTVSVIKSARFKGYLVSGQANNISNKALMEKVFANLNEEMQKQNEALSTLCGVLDLKLDSIPFKQWSEQKAEFIVGSQLGRDEVQFAFIPVEELPKSFIDEDLVPVEIEHFEADKPLFFDIFLHLPLNHKHILYMKNGAILTGNSRQRLVSYNTKVLYVRKEDQNLFYAYCARNVFEAPAIARSIPTPKNRVA